MKMKGYNLCNFPFKIKNQLVLLVLCVLTVFSLAFDVGRFRGVTGRKLYGSRPLFLCNEEKEEDDETIDLSERDWRAFRAKLVMQPSERKEKREYSEDDDVDGIGAALSCEEPTQWAYDSGFVVERGAVILGGVEQEFGFGLRQQYFHKVVMLVLEHDESKFTKGIILNRPSDAYLDLSKKWKVWFGGDVQNLDSAMPEVVCLHSLRSKEAKEVSFPVLKNILWTTYRAARKLVSDEIATPEDFWVFVGYAGWGPNQLMGELKRKSWYMVDTDSQTLLEELARQSRTSDPRNAGLDTWEQLMCMIRKQTQVKQSNQFDDLMLKEWARDKLCQEFCVATNLTQMNTPPGTLLRASSLSRSPFLLRKQEYHKSLLLVLNDDEKLTIAVLLNHPAKSLQLDVKDKSSRQPFQLTTPLRYGGQYSITGASTSLLWLHCHEEMKVCNVGSPINPSIPYTIWKCTTDEATSAIAKGIANCDDFLIVSGVSIFLKDNPTNDIQRGFFEPVDPAKTPLILQRLQQQQILTESSMLQNLAIAKDAWMATGDSKSEKEDRKVFKSDRSVSTLSDDALRHWVATFLLGQPGLA